MKISTLVDSYQDTNNVMIALPEEGDEQHFSRRGCEICGNGLGNDVWDVNIVDKDTLDVIDTISVCHDVICYLANGDDTEVES
jgi:hypothetical protein